MFQIPESYIYWILTGCSVLCALFTLFYFLKPQIRVGKELSRRANYERESQRETGNKAAIRNSGRECLKASVIVFSFVSEEELTPFLERICAQDYPDFEVIVVCDTTSESAEVISERYSRQFPNVYVTFIPPGSHNLSRRKLALTIGMKAAKGELVVTTVSNALIPSERWLSLLLAPFTEENGKTTDISLGYSHINRHEMHGWGKWYREFNTLLTDSQWIGYALDRRPYRGDGYNLAFRRQIFFEHKGYAKSIYLHSGDDDLFVSEIANRENTAVSILPDNILSTQWGAAAKRMWRQHKEQYGFTSRWLRRGAFRRAGMASAMQWIIPALCAGAVLTEWPLVVPMIISGVILLMFWLGEILIYRKMASALQATRLWWAVAPFWLAKPVLNFIFRLRHRRQKHKNYTWQR